MCSLVHVGTLNNPDDYNQCQKETLRVFLDGLDITGLSWIYLNLFS